MSDNQFKCSFNTTTCPKLLKYPIGQRNEPCYESVDGHMFCLWCSASVRSGEEDESECCVHHGCWANSVMSTDDKYIDDCTRLYCKNHMELIKNGRKICLDLDKNGCSCVLSINNQQCPGFALEIIFQNNNKTSFMDI